MALDPGGGGDVVPIDPEQCQFEKLAAPVCNDMSCPILSPSIINSELRHICDLLNWKDHNCLMQVCFDFKAYFEYVYGIHAYLPPRNFNLGTWSIMKLIMGRLAAITRQVTDDILGQTIFNLEGKVVLSLKMNELHPQFNPFPFEKLIRFPNKLKEVSLKYVDVQFLINILTSCRNLTVFHYETGLQRKLPQGPIAWILLRTSFQPVPIPSMNEQLIEFLTHLPPPNFQVRNLTSLSLSMETMVTQLHSDWANVLFLLLSLSSSNLNNLRDFKFALKFGTFTHSPKDRLQIVACVGHFLTRCPNLQKLEYTSGLPAERRWIWFDEENRIMDTTRGLPQNVISGLIQKYGSELLKEVLHPNVLGWKRRMLAPIRQIMQEAGRNLGNIQKASFQLMNPIEATVFQHLLSSLPSPSMERIEIDDYAGQRLSDPNYFTSLLPAAEHRQQCAYHQRIERVCVHRRCNWPLPETENDTGISLSRMLTNMRSLKHLEITAKMPIEDAEMMDEDEWADIIRIHDPLYELDPIDIPDDNGNLVNAEGGGQSPDILIEDIADRSIFTRVEVLKLAGVKLTVESAARLSQWTNLKELSLLIIPEHRHQLFGINSVDLLQMMGSLRKLNKLSVSMVYLPQEPTLNLAHRNALQEMGSLGRMHRWRIFDDDEDALNNLYLTEPMMQYKFLF